MRPCGKWFSIPERIATGQKHPQPASDYPGRNKFARLTAQEERRGLYADPAMIGTRKRWGELLESRGLRLRGHRLVRQELTAD